MTILTLENVTPRQLRAIADILEDGEAVIPTTSATVASAGEVVAEVAPAEETPAPAAEEKTTGNEENYPSLFNNTEGQEPNAAEVFGGNSQAAAPAAAAGSEAQTPRSPQNDVAPATTAAGAAPVASSGEVDSAGFPWDGRIHARTKTKIADGTWKKKRGIDDATVQAVQAECAGNPAPTATAPANSTASSASVESAQPQAQPMQQPAAQPQQTATTGSPGEAPTYSSIVQQIVNGVAQQKFTAPDAQKVLNDHGVADTNALATRDDVFPQIAAALEVLANG